MFAFLFLFFFQKQKMVKKHPGRTPQELFPIKVISTQNPI